MPTSANKIEVIETALTPVQKVGSIWLKRDDLWNGPRWRGGKARTAEIICMRAKEKGITEVCIAVDRNSSVPGMVSRVCKWHGVGLRAWLPAAKDELPKVFTEAKANGAVLEEVRPGYMSVRRKRLRDYVAASGGKAVELEVGLLWDDCGRKEIAKQTTNVEELFRAGQIKRVVVPVGSGGMLRGVADGLASAGIPVLGVCCGNLPDFAEELPLNVELIKSSRDFGDKVIAKIGDVDLDPVYEAKCAECLQEGDLLWIVAHRDTQ